MRDVGRFYNQLICKLAQINSEHRSLMVSRQYPVSCTQPATGSIVEHDTANVNKGRVRANYVAEHVVHYSFSMTSCDDIEDIFG